MTTMLTRSVLTTLVTQSAGSLALTMGILCSNATGHTLDDLKKEMTEIPAPLLKITKLYEAALNQTYEKQSAGLDPIELEGLRAEGDAISARLHATQHEMLHNARLKMKCVELLKAIPAQERRLQELKKAGKADEAEQVQTRIDEAKAIATVNCPPPLR